MLKIVINWLTYYYDKRNNVFMMENIAQNIIDKCGGVRPISLWLKITTKSVYCWTYPKSKGGSGGLVPSKYQSPLLQKAVESGVNLSPNDFMSFEVNTKVKEVK